MLDMVLTGSWLWLNLLKVWRGIAKGITIILVQVKSETNIKRYRILLLINDSISYKHLSVGQIKLPICLIVFTGVCLVPFIRLELYSSTAHFFWPSEECLKHLCHLSFLLLQAFVMGIADTKKKSIFIYSTLYQQAWGETICWRQKASSRWKYF